MLELVIHFILQKYPQHKIDSFISGVWTPLEQQEGLRGERAVVIDSSDKLTVEMVRNVPFLQLVDVGRYQVKFTEYDTSFLPTNPFERGIKALQLLFITGDDKYALGREFCSTDNEDSINSTGANILRDLKLLALNTSQGITQNAKSYLKTGEVGYLADALLTEPSWRLFYSLFTLLATFGDRQAIRDAILQITRLIFYNSLGDNRITETVAEKRVGHLISWFQGTGLLDKDLAPILAVEEPLLFKKKVDFSLFEDGLVIPKEHHAGFFEVNREVLPVGERRDGWFILPDQEYVITFLNMRRGAKGDTIQIRYDKNHELRNEIIQRFRVSYDYIMSRKTEKRQRVEVPDDQAEYLLTYATGQPYNYRITFLTAGEKEEYKNTVAKLHRLGQDTVEELCEMSDIDFSKYISTLRDEEASYTARQGLVHYRKLRNTLVNELKKRYHNCCQICLHSFKDTYGMEYSEGHHIKPFAETADHSPENIVILCPNHHRIIHKANAQFDREKKAFIFDNGHVEVLQCNHHL